MRIDQCDNCNKYRLVEETEQGYLCGECKKMAITNQKIAKKSIISRIFEKVVK